MQEYFTLDNRDCPFKVTIENNDIKIYKYKNNRLLYSFTNVYQYFVAESPWTKSSYTDASYVGNCILIRPTNKLKYYLVSDSIYKFKTDIKIENFISDLEKLEKPKQPAAAAPAENPQSSAPAPGARPAPIR